MAAIIVFSDCISVELGTERESGDRVALLLLLLLWGKKVSMLREILEPLILTLLCGQAVKHYVDTFM